MKTGKRPNIHRVELYPGITLGKVVPFRPKPANMTDETGASTAIQGELTTLCVIICLAQAFDFIELKKKLPTIKCVKLLRTVMMVEHDGGLVDDPPIRCCSTLECYC